MKRVQELQITLNVVKRILLFIHLFSQWESARSSIFPFPSYFIFIFSVGQKKYLQLGAFSANLRIANSQFSFKHPLCFQFANIRFVFDISCLVEFCIQLPQFRGIHQTPCSSSHLLNSYLTHDAANAIQFGSENSTFEICINTISSNQFGAFTIPLLHGGPRAAIFYFVCIMHYLTDHFSFCARQSKNFPFPNRAVNVSWLKFVLQFDKSNQYALTFVHLSRLVVQYVSITAYLFVMIVS